MRQVIIYPGEDGYWVAECLSLPGCISQGATREEAVANIKEAITAYIEALEQDALPVPPDHTDALLIAVLTNSRASQAGSVLQPSSEQAFTGYASRVAT
jgi:predicted RNase H-like HicB family nuclease